MPRPVLCIAGLPDHEAALLAPDLRSLGYDVAARPPALPPAPPALLATRDTNGGSSMSDSCGIHKFIGFAVLLLLLVAAGLASAQSVTDQQMRSLLPPLSDLPGFSHTEPAGNIPRSLGGVSPARLIPTRIRLERDLRGRGLSGKASSIGAPFFSDNAMHYVSIGVSLCDSPATARLLMQDQRRRSSGTFQSGSLTGKDALGEESQVLVPANLVSSVCGRLNVVVNGSPTHVARSKGFADEFPAAAVDALVHSVIVRASRLVALTGVQSRPVSVVAKGRSMPAGAAIEIGNRVYVRPTAFAAAAGWKHHWNARSGVLSLANGAARSVVLPTVPGQAQAPITVPIWVAGGQPMMVLSDLATLANGQVHKGQANTHRVSLP